MVSESGPTPHCDVTVPAEYPLSELITWLETAAIRWENDGAKVTVRREGGALNVYQDGKYRAAVVLDERPMLTDWADEDA